MTDTHELHWQDLSDPQKLRLLSISRGEESDGDETWVLLWSKGLIDYVEGHEIDYLTPAGGKLLQERDALLTGALEAVVNNAPTEEPKGTMSGNRTPLLWAFWVAGETARNALAQAGAKEAGG